jgi:hypothetical protein
MMTRTARSLDASACLARGLHQTNVLDRFIDRPNFVGTPRSAVACIAVFLSNQRACFAGTSFDTPFRIVFPRSVASLLVVLITVPFTAPFSTCDLSLLLPASPNARQSQSAVSKDGRAASIEEAGASQAAASVLEEEQFKSARLADVANTVSFDVRSLVSAPPITPVSPVRTLRIALRL